MIDSHVLLSCSLFQCGCPVHNPVLPFLVFLEFLVFSPARNSLFFSSVFPFFSRDFRGSVGIKNPCFLVVFRAFFQKTKERKDREHALAGIHWGYAMRWVTWRRSCGMSCVKAIPEPMMSNMNHVRRKWFEKQFFVECLHWLDEGFYNRWGKYYLPKISGNNSGSSGVEITYLNPPWNSLAFRSYFGNLRELLLILSCQRALR